MKSKGFALMTVLIIVILVPIVVFGVTFFITSSISRHDAQARNMTALYLAQSGIQKVIYNLKAGVSPFLTVTNPDASNTISVVEAHPNACGIYQLCSTGTSVVSGNSISRKVFAQYQLSTDKVQIYIEGDGANIPGPTGGGGGSLVAYWPFSEGSGLVTNTSPVVANYQGALLTSGGGSYPAWVAGKVGNALNFNYNNRRSYVEIPDRAGLDLSTGGTIMAWAKFDSVQNNIAMVHKGANANQTDEAYGLTLNGSHFSLQVRTASANVVLQGSITPSAGIWYHVAGMWNASGMSVYVNGVLNVSNNTVVSARNTSGPLEFGILESRNSTGRFRGTLDEVYLYNGAICGSQIETYYNSTCTPQPGCQV